MMKQVELSSLDLRYENCRIKSSGYERILMGSIAEQGIRDPLQGVDTPEVRILLDGFKRYRCAKRLGIGIVPYRLLGTDEAGGIISLLRISTAKSLSILEQATFIDELMSNHGMSNGEIAGNLEKSKSWVSVRAGIIGEMSECVRKKLLSGQFPTYSYMYTLRQFIRINCVTKKEVDEFVTLVSGKHLSIRNIEILAYGFFKGSEGFRQQLRSGNISWGLNSLRASSVKIPVCSEVERSMLKDLEITQKYLQRVTCKSRDVRFKTNSFYSQANLLSGGILRQIPAFTQAIGAFHDRSGQT